MVLQHVLTPQNVMAVNTSFQDHNAFAYYMLGTPVHSKTQMVSLGARSTAEHTFSVAEVTLGRLLSLYIGRASVRTTSRNIWSHLEKKEG